MLGRFLSIASIECIAQAHLPQTVSVEVSLNGQQYTSAKASYFFHEDVVVATFIPYRGISGGSIITINGANFITGYCNIAYADLGQQQYLRRCSPQLEPHCYSPALHAGYVALEVSSNMQDFSSSSNIFTYHLSSFCASIRALHRNWEAKKSWSSGPISCLLMRGASGAFLVPALQLSPTGSRTHSLNVIFPQRQLVQYPSAL